MNYWMYGLGDSPGRNAVLLAQAGLQCVVASWRDGTPSLIRTKGLIPYTCLGAFSLPKQAGHSLLAQTLEGRPVVWFGSGCPNQPAIREQSLALYAEAAQSDVEGVFIDGARFSSPASAPQPDAFFTCFCPTCMKKAELLGYDPMQIRKDVRTVSMRLTEGLPLPPVRADLLREYPGLSEWFRFRADCSVEFVAQASQIVRAEGKRFGAFVFAPSLSRLVGQPYDQLAPHLDILSPMLYRSYWEAPGTAALNYEYARLYAWLVPSFGDKAAQVLSNWFGLSFSPSETEGEILGGLSMDNFKAEVQAGKKTCPASVTYCPIFDSKDPLLDRQIQAAKELDIGDAAFFRFYQEEFNTESWKSLLQKK